MRNNVNIGIAGAGSFAAFAVKAFLQHPDVKIIGVHDINEIAAKQLSQKAAAKYYSEYKALLNDKNIDLIYIATPPFLHYGMAKDALNAGKNVICEKPAALRLSEAEELKQLAEKKDLLYVVNLMQRYNPLYILVKKIIDEKLMGNFLHGFFENYASDETLDASHWFWNENKSGGIFIEHAVHFFDMFSGWLGEGKVISALQLHRENVTPKIFDRVQATVLYNNSIVNFYHGFDQPKILDRQEMCLQFERGEITLYEWIPVKMKLHGLFTKEKLKDLEKLIGSCSVIHHDNKEQVGKMGKGKFIDIAFDDHVTMEKGNTHDKQNRYQQMLTDMLQDQWNWIKNKDHQRIIDGSNAVESIRMAVEAKHMAQKL